MASIFQSIFSSKYPRTEQYEAQIQKLHADYKRFQEYESSDKYVRFQELDQLTNSGDFLKKVDQLKNEKFKDTKEHRQLQEYKSLKKSSDLKSYFKYKASGFAEKLDSIKESARFTDYLHLKDAVESDAFIEARNTKGFKKSDAYKDFKKYKGLKRSSDIKFYFKQLNSARYKNYLNIKDSDRLDAFKKLEKLVQSEAFLSFKKDMEDPQRFKKSEEYALLSEYEDIKKTPEYIWFAKTAKSNGFEEIGKWQLTFEDDFDATSINKDKWINGYYWGKALLNDVYVLSHERQFFTDNNVKLRNGVACLTTKNEKVEGKVWDEQFGFVPRDFNYSSALISTGQSFRQKYGKIEAKVKVDHSAPLNHAFWMVGENIAPQIDVFRFAEKGAKGFTVGCHRMDKEGNAVKQVAPVNGVKFNSDYFIFGLEWYKDRLAWFVNGVKVHEQIKDVPQDPMYFVFSSHLLEENENMKLPAEFKIDWIRCYQESK